MKCIFLQVLHNRIVKICPEDNGLGGTVTVALTPGFSFARPVFYVGYVASSFFRFFLHGWTSMFQFFHIQTVFCPSCSKFQSYGHGQTCSLDASEDIPATLEHSTLAPGLRDLKVGVDDTLYSAVERIFITINGHTNADIKSTGVADGPDETSHPSRQVRVHTEFCMYTSLCSAYQCLSG